MAVPSRHTAASDNTLDVVWITWDDDLLGAPNSGFVIIQAELRLANGGQKWNSAHIKPKTSNSFESIHE